MVLRTRQLSSYHFVNFTLCGENTNDPTTGWTILTLCSVRQVKRIFFKSIYRADMFLKKNFGLDDCSNLLKNLIFHIETFTIYSLNVVVLRSAVVEYIL